MNVECLPAAYNALMRPIHCSQCKYDLSGLPGAGTCPECGQHYWVTRGKGIHTTTSGEVRGRRFAKKLRTLALLIAGLLLIVIGAALQFWAGRQNALLTGAGVGALILLCAGISYGLQGDDD